MKLKIYFSGGNVVTVRNVESWGVGGNGSINSLKIAHKKTNFFQRKSKLIVKSVNLDRIDCIVEC